MRQTKLGATEVLEGLDWLADLLRAQGTDKVLVITGRSQRFVDRLPLGELGVTLFDDATVHVPRAVVAAASTALVRSEADTMITIGGGSATGLGKALRLEHDVRFIAVPTTYSGSEMTNLYGITEDGSKTTGRDDRVRPDCVVHEPSLFVEMPKKLTTTSLLNALAHPVSALSTGALSTELRRDALSAVRELAEALVFLLEDPSSPEGRRLALRGSALAGSIIDRAKLGDHHGLAHLLGGRFGLDHSGLHSVLLCQFVHRLFETDRALFDELADATRCEDLPATLYDGLTRAGASRSVLELGASGPAEARPLLEAIEELAKQDGRLTESWAQDAVLGRRPSVRTRRHDAGGCPATTVRGPEPSDAERVLIALHGRGANAGRFTADVLNLIGYDPDTTIIAPQAPGNSWYPKGYTASLDEHGRDLDGALAVVDGLLDEVLAEVPASKVYLVGFSQGACLASEVLSRRSDRIAGLVAIAGARIGPRQTQPAVAADLTGTRVVLGAAEGDRWLNLADIEHTAEQFRAAGAQVDLVPSCGDAHEITAAQRAAAREAILDVSVRTGMSGFGNAHESEALRGALPPHQNSPRKAAYGLYAEQINGSGFVARRHDNVRTWFYRVRPSAQHTPLQRIDHPTLVADWDDGAPEPNLCGWDPLPLPEGPTDFVDGLATFGGAGSPSLRRGYAIHLYAANRSMEHRAFYDSDGDLLIIPQQGALLLQTELGLLDVSPGQIAIVPRGLKFSVQLRNGASRGYVGETYGRRFELPERGPVGSNGLSDPRHFRAPTAFFEDRVDPGYRITVKFDNAIFEATQDHSPYDVVAWHGDLVPYVYDLSDFSPVGNTRFDHPDPSIHTVLAAPMDETGADTLDFVFFPPRWDPTEHTFRPPFLHRNATAEFNGIIADPGLGTGPFSEGCYFLTPSMTPHAVLSRAMERNLSLDDVAADEPVRIGDASKWFQFETALPLTLTSWARNSSNRIQHWPSVWGAHRSHFDG